MSHSSSDSDDEVSNASYDEELAIEAKRALAYLQINRHYRYIEFLAQGGYGWVALVYDDEKDRPLAVKCTSDTSAMELSWWPRLDHSNILPLLEHIAMDSCTVFIMPAMRKDLWELINEPRFYDEELSFGLCRVWLRDVASALAYLHGQFLCHLDLKLDNVFLKTDGYVCLGDFSLLSDIREVPAGFHFLEIYEPPEYTQWCHGVPPEAIASATVFGGDKADMWQYGILALDLLSNLKVTSSKTTDFTLFHHDIWPVLQKIILHEEYLSFLLEETFVNVVFQKEDFRLCHDFIKNILILEPDVRISAEEARNHAFINIEWPQLPKEFTVPAVIEEFLPKPLPLPKEELKDPTLSADDVVTAAEEKKREDPGTSAAGAPDCLDVMLRKMKKLKREKMVRRESILVDAGKKPLEIKAPPAALQRQATPWAKKNSEDDKDRKSEVKVTTHAVKLPSGKKHPIKVTSVKKTNAKRISPDAKKKSDDRKSHEAKKKNLESVDKKEK